MRVLGRSLKAIFATMRPVYYFGASEATRASKRGPLRSGSHSGAFDKYPSVKWASPESARSRRAWFTAASARSRQAGVMSRPEK